MLISPTRFKKLVNEVWGKGRNSSSALSAIDLVGGDCYVRHTITSEGVSKQRLVHFLFFTNQTGSNFGIVIGPLRPLSLVF